MKGLVRTVFISVFLVAVSAASAHAAPVIKSAAIDYDTGRITLNGTGLVYRTGIPKVIFMGITLTIAGTPTATAVTAQLPGGLVPGTYLVQVKNGAGTSPNFDLAYCAARPQR